MTAPLTPSACLHLWWARTQADQSIFKVTFAHWLQDVLSPSADTQSPAISPVLWVDDGLQGTPLSVSLDEPVRDKSSADPSSPLCLGAPSFGGPPSTEKGCRPNPYRATSGASSPHKRMPAKAIPSFLELSMGLWACLALVPAVSNMRQCCSTALSLLFLVDACSSWAGHAGERRAGNFRGASETVYCQKQAVLPRHCHHLSLGMCPNILCALNLVSPSTYPKIQWRIFHKEHIQRSHGKCFRQVWWVGSQ